MIHDSNLSGMMSGLSFNDDMVNSVSNIQEIERLQKEVINYQVQLKLLTRLLNEKLRIDNNDNNNNSTRIRQMIVQIQIQIQKLMKG
ncbi:unnamed protein product [[Candida] boidinii]|nr:unnamed protein product [[Candida] boidinii]